ncbi:hypothetical protein BDA96_10G043000 [Sorghum bicolor]|uniref:Uncharacterized protein n=2 Tax=Sorghum bicolor TaxID=4558 RepID=A0A921TZK9_SORBI|nr:hypothetical protein BDA96_10G043000 [Sorghum bicolor]KXG19295.1 hypothetical protein SORBI_3010G037000 [Sorghum bicolor]
MANPQPSSLPDPFLPPIVGAASRLAHGGRLADVAFPDLNLALLFLSLRWFHLSPPGSAARRRARFFIWVASSSITLGVAWGLVGPPTFEAGMWGFAAFSVLASLYLLIFY